MNKIVTAFFFCVLIFSNVVIAQWTQLSAPEGGAILGMFADGSNLYAGTAGAGVFRSTDGGATWEQKINGMNYQSVTAFVKSGPNLLATGTVNVYLSTDNGETWTAATGLAGGNGVSCLAANGANVFAGTSGRGVFVSTDNGATWTASNTGLPGGGTNTYVGSIITNGSTILTSASDNNVQQTMFRSTNNGSSWTGANTGLPLDYSTYGSMYLDGSTIYAGGSYLYKTTNNGDTWTQADNGIPTYSGISEIRAIGSNLFATANQFVYRSTDGGGTWTVLGGGLPLMGMFSLEVSGSDVFAGTVANGVYKSTDSGNSWTQQNTGLKARDMSGFLIDGSTLYANGNSIFKTSDDGTTWTNVRGNLKDSSSQPTLVYANGSLLFARDYPANGLERSTDGGATWTLVGNGLPEYGSINSIIDVAGGLLTTKDRVYRSTDNGDTWVKVDTASEIINVGNVVKIGSMVYAYGLGVFKSSDEGTTWVKADSGFPAYFQIGALAGTSSVLFASGSFSGGTYKSTNGGQSWAIISANIYSQFFVYGNNLFGCRANNGIFVHKNFATSATKFSGDLPGNTYTYTFTIHNGNMYAGTSGNGVWKRPLTDVLEVKEIASGIPTGFSLEQNYPNPFNPTTNFEFRIVNFSAKGGSASGGGLVTLKVFDILGREVATLVNENLHPGTFSVSWDATGQASGIYYYRLQSGEFSETRKLLLTK
ncbi:MAG: T9SS type A sorting domain-containing protein [Ignavibacteriae bacterium]|nr:T9SS type A sorting domain-containing protein [Ignavibacteriota bacterium]